MKTDAFLNWQTRLTKIEQCLIWEAPAICKGKSKNAVTHVPTDILFRDHPFRCPKVHTNYKNAVFKKKIGGRCEN